MHFEEFDPTELIQDVQTLLEQDYPGGVTEHALLKRLSEAPYGYFPNTALNDSHTLFKVHFLLFHCLYRIQQDTHAGLIISPLNIQIAATAVISGSKQLPDEADPLKAYYLDLSHLYETGADTVDQMLGKFWARHLSEAEEVDALAVLDLEPPTNYREISLKFKQLIRIHHPDRGGSTEAMQRINQAMDLLKRKYRS